MRLELVLAEQGDGSFKVFDQWDISHMRGTREQCERLIADINACNHEASEELTFNFNHQNGELEIECNVCGAEASFPLPTNLEWS